MAWTDDRVEVLKKMWSEGNSASQIAKILGGVTRNAVIGKVHRLGLSNRATTKSAKTAKAKPTVKPTIKTSAAPRATSAQKPKKPASTAAPVAPMRKPIVISSRPLPPQPSNNEVSAEALANVSELEKKAKKLTLMQLTERTCKWPIGDPATDTFWFCGHPAQTGKPYCETHVAVAFQPVTSRRDRRTSR